MTQDTTAQARLGTIEETDEGQLLRYERNLDHPIERVWAALTQPDELVGWLAAAEELELAEGGRITLRWLNVPEDTGEWEKQGVEIPEDHDLGAAISGTITQLDPPRLIEYETDTMGRLRWELRPAEDGCVLTFTNTIELPEGAPPEQTLAGWHIHLNHLEDALAGHPIEWSGWTDRYLDEWSRIRDRYAASGS